ncbi:inter-alpha-trypsin inhibitor heavy chain H6 isoform X2 [Hippocampus comes]|uniref:inter-alpha-trypsin inhibitor heavy chain H6 isoform X2 n=1 Tax=Hippocampus comes TaxID=109280 RepID=UPI00094E772B|nr:PREDICTED: inter-alpha-trypsin inhibitor heavy chain H6 isoform X2 [Hippocampus comes]
MGMMLLSIQCILLFFLFYAQEGLSRDYSAHPGQNLPRRAKRQSKATRPVLKVTDYHVKCCVVSRYAITSVQSSIWNQMAITKEAAFEVDLPSSAFISNFSITSGGKVYAAQVKERATARKMYDTAKKQGKTAGLIATKEREIEKFRVAVSVPPGARMSFCLTYEELLPRRLGRYELSVGLRPGQPVSNLTLDVSLVEQTGVAFIKVLPLRTSRLLSNNNAQGDAGPPASTQVEESVERTRIRYTPSPQQQVSISPKGLNADFVIQYDVNLTDLMGDIQVFDGYFVHYFAPRGLPVVPKDVIFVIDVSGSMIGTKIKQTKQAMNTILGDLREGDHFNIVTFSDKVHTWKKGCTVRATRQNVRDAKEFVKRIIAEGWTNINAALLSAAQLVNPPSSGSRRVPLVVFLTDGEATIGVTAGDIILSNAKKALGSASLFGLAFGDDADFPLLKRLALDNRGVARMVYEDADAALQLKGFYDEVASPLLSDVQLDYLDHQAFDVTRSLFPNYFRGSELVVAGRLRAGLKDFKVSLSANDSKRRIKLENDVLINSTWRSPDCSGSSEGMSSFVRRLWAYFTIKELLLAKLNTTDAVSQKLLADKAINLSLEYNFVTPVTSLVVVKPDADKVTPPTVKPSASASITTTATTKTSAAKRPQPSSNLRTSKPNPPRQPKKTSVPPPAAKTVKTTPTSRLAATQPTPVPFSGKKPPQNESKSSSVPPAGKLSSSLLHFAKTAQPPAPGKISTPSSPFIVPTVASSGTTPALPKRSSTSAPVTRRTEPESSTTSPHPDITGTQPHLSSGLTPPTPTPVPAPDLEGNVIKASAESDVRVANLVAATFAPMPGVTDGPRPWEAAGLLDVSTSIQIHRKDIDLVKDYEATYDYDYDLDYDAWGNAADTESFVLGGEEDCPLVECLVLLEPPSRLSAEHFSSSADGDPHFVLQLPKQQQNLCFTVDGRPNDVLRLVEDPQRGITVDGHLTGAPPKRGHENRSRTYFDRLSISAAAGHAGIIAITVSLEKVVVEGEGRETLTVNRTGSVTRQGVTVDVDNHQGCWIELADDVRFLVLFHHYKHPSYLQMAHLGFYITRGLGLSASTGGLLGQFQHAAMSVAAVSDYHHSENSDGKLVQGVLRRGTQLLRVTLQDKMLKDTLLRRHVEQCWVVPKSEVERLLGQPYARYVVDGV